MRGNIGPSGDKRLLPIQGLNYKSISFADLQFAKDAINLCRFTRVVCALELWHSYHRTATKP